MNGIVEYAVESSICLALLWAFYEIVLRRDTNHRRNRLYLIGSMIFSFIVPLLNFSVPGAGTLIPMGGLQTILLPEFIVMPSGQSYGTRLVFELLPWIYIGGVAISFIFLMAGSAYLIRLRSTGETHGIITTFHSTSQACFSALGHIYISSSVTGSDAKRMINHEMKHINLMHHSDLILSGAVIILQWFNPAAYLIRKSLLAIHEFEADNICINEGEDPVSYSELLLASVFRSHSSVFSNTFSNRSLLKNRIIMMTKKRTGSKASLKMIMAIPLAFMLIVLFACNNNKSTPAGTKAAPDQTATEQAAPEGATSEMPDDVYKVVDQMPVFSNDTSAHALFKWLTENIEYPEVAKKNGIQGKVVVRFVIDENGNVINPEVIQNVDPALDKAALDVISKCPQWEPGKQKGKPVKVSMAIPITFALN